MADRYTKFVLTVIALALLLQSWVTFLTMYYSFWFRNAATGVCGKGPAWACFIRLVLF